VPRRGALYDLLVDRVILVANEDHPENEADQSAF